MSQDTSQNVTQDLSRAEALISPSSDALTDVVSDALLADGSPPDASKPSAAITEGEIASETVASVASDVAGTLDATTEGTVTGIGSGVEPGPTATTLDAQTAEALGAAQADGSETPAAAYPRILSEAERVVTLLRTSAREWLANVQIPPSPRTIRLLAAACSALLLLALLPTLLNTSRHNAGATSAPPTATTVPTATPLPSPTAMPGYQPLVDGADGFVIQYPLTWTCSSSNPGVDCIDSPTEQNYRLQVQLPGSWTGAATGKNANDASVWVDYALSAFSDVPGRTYQRLADANQTAVIGGVTWSGGAAVVGIEPDGSSGNADATATPTAPLVLIRVQVYATLYNNRPYIIALYAANDQYTTGSSHYFQPMLNTFAFLPSGNAS